MEDQTLLLSSLSALLLLLAFKFLFLSKSKKQYKYLPPSPPSLPFIGHLYLIKPLTHRILRNLSQKYGPIMSLRFGSRLVVVISSTSAARECLTKNDIVLANRSSPNSLFGKHVGYNYTTLGTSPYGDHWRNLRHIISLEVFSSSRLNQHLGIRKDEIKRLLLNLASNSRQDFAKAKLKSMIVELTFNIVTRVVAGKRHDAEQFNKLIKDISAAGGFSSTAAKNFPILKWVGYETEETKIIKIGTSMDKVLQEVVDERRRHGEQGDRDAMIDHLLSKQESDPEYCSDEIIKGLILDLFLAGIETFPVTIEWAMTSLLNHPEVLNNAKEEIDAQVGEERLVDEPDVLKLPYLESIMWETLRLHPPKPLLIPHTSSEDCTIGGYDVPGGTTVLTNAFAIHRDPSLWDDPECFKPERFDENNEVKGSHNKLLPFGLGRRSCPGSGLAQRVVSLTLASMIQCFEWRRTSEEKVDLTEGKGIIMPKAYPLEAMCKARPIVDKVLYGN